MTNLAVKTSVVRGLAGVALVLALGAPAFAQSADKSTDAPAVKSMQPEWLKVCGKDDKAGTEMCSVTSFITADAGNVVGEVRLFEVKKGKDTKRIFEALIPPGFLIQPGVNLVIDDPKNPIAGRYRICFPNACMTEVQVTDDVLTKFRKGNTLTFFAANAQGKWVPAKVSLSGFTKAYDGPALDPKVYDEKRKAFQENQKKLQDELVARAEEQRKKLQEQAKTDKAGDKAPAAPTPAPKQ